MVATITGEGFTFANRGSAITPLQAVDTATVNYGTFLQPGESASYPTSLYTASNYNHGGSNGLPAGAIAGIAVGSVAAALLIAFLVFLLIMSRRKKAKKAKRESGRHLLPTSHSVQSYTDGTATPEMSQRSHAGAGAAAVFATESGGGAAVDSSQLQEPVATAAPKSQRKTGFMFGSYGRGHRRAESTSSSSPFLPGSPTSGYSGRTSASFDYPRLSTDMPYAGRPSTSYGGSPLTAHTVTFPENAHRASLESRQA